MKRGLEAESYEVAIASSKAQTLDLIEACTYDVIILDIFLGPDDGLDICRALRQRGVKSSILLMTAKGTAEVEKMSKQAGADVTGHGYVELTGYAPFEPIGTSNWY